MIDHCLKKRGGKRVGRDKPSKAGLYGTRRGVEEKK